VSGTTAPSSESLTSGGMGITPSLGTIGGLGGNAETSEQ
jgi:hypothetical protein